MGSPVKGQKGIRGSEVAAFFKEVYKTTCKETKTTVSVKSHYTESGAAVSEKLDIRYLTCELPIGKKPTVTVRLVKKARETHLYKGNFNLTCSESKDGSLRCSSPTNAYHFTLARAKKGLKLVHGHTTSYAKDIKHLEKTLHSFLLASKSSRVDTNWIPASW